MPWANNFCTEYLHQRNSHTKMRRMWYACISQYISNFVAVSAHYGKLNIQNTMDSHQGISCSVRSSR